MFVIVLETPCYTTAKIRRNKRDGKKFYESTYEIANIPPGEYKLVTWNKKLNKHEQDIVVAAGDPTVVDLELKK